MRFLQESYQKLINKLLEMTEGEREWKHALENLAERRKAFLVI